MNPIHHCLLLDCPFLPFFIRLLVLQMTLSLFLVLLPPLVQRYILHSLLVLTLSLFTLLLLPHIFSLLHVFHRAEAHHSLSL